MLGHSQAHFGCALALTRALVQVHLPELSMSTAAWHFFRISPKSYRWSSLMLAGAAE